MESKELVQIKRKVAPVIERAEAFEITSNKDMVEATEILSNLNRYHDQIVETREKITAPLNASLKAARDMFSPVEKPAKAAIEALRGRIGAWQTAEAKRVEEEEDKLAGRIGSGKGKLKPETAMAKMDDIDRPEDAIHTDAGALKFRKDPILEITDEAKVPKEYWIIDEKRLFADLKEGKEVKGAKIGFKLVPVNSR